MDHSENVYASRFVINSTDVFYSSMIINSYKVYNSNNLISCQYCINCSHLENQIYCIDNKKVTEEEFKVYLASYRFDSIDNQSENVQCENVEGSGNYLSSDLKNAYYTFSIK